MNTFKSVLTLMGLFSTITLTRAQELNHQWPYANFEYAKA